MQYNDILSNNNNFAFRKKISGPIEKKFILDKDGNRILYAESYRHIPRSCFFALAFARFGNFLMLLILKSEKLSIKEEKWRRKEGRMTN